MARGIGGGRPEAAEVQAVYTAIRIDEHRRALSDMVMEPVAKDGFDVRLGRYLPHGA